jgi:hypothetical protein
LRFEVFMAMKFVVGTVCKARKEALIDVRREGIVILSGMPIIGYPQIGTRVCILRLSRIEHQTAELEMFSYIVKSCDGM